MATVSGTTEFWQRIINRIVMTDPDVNEIMRQLQGQQDADINAQRTPAPARGNGADTDAEARAFHAATQADRAGG